MSRPWAWALVGLLCGCGLGPSVGGSPRFVCAVDEECAAGHRCDEGLCAPVAPPADAGAADAGAADDGGPVSDAGAVDDGGPVVVEDAGVVDAGPPRALVVSPSVAGVGRELWLEGRFGEGVQIRFPGGVEVEAGHVGPARVAVEVPANAARGALSVIVDGSERKGPDFSRPGYAIALSSVRGDDEQASVARTMPRLGTPRRALSAVVAGGRLYAIGGEAAAGPIAGIESAPMFADGSLGTFVDEEIALVTARSGAASARAGDFLYLAGGEGSEGMLSSVERAPVLEGSLGGFELLAESPLDEPRARAAAVVVGHWLYVVGGQGEDGPLSSVVRATIGADGALGPFAPVSTSLARPRAGHQALVVGSRLYAIGGEVDGAPSTSVEVAEVAGDGAIGAFTEAPASSLVQPRAGAIAVALDDDVYVLGAGSLERASVSTDGLGAFLLGSLAGPSSSDGHAAVVGGDFLYVLGGVRAGAPSAGVERASLRAGVAEPTAFVDDGPSLPRGQTYPSVAVIGPWLYVIGGNSRADGNTAAVHRARIQPDGTLGAFETSGALDAPRAYACTAVLGDWLYLVGGATVNAAPIASVLRAPIDEDGDLGAFTDAGVSLVTPRHAATCTVIGERLWVFGGSQLATIESAPVLDDGALGGFVTESRTLAERRSFASTALIDGKLMIAGGYVENQVVDTYEVAEVGEDGSVGPFTVASLPAPLCCSGTAVVGTRVYFLGGQTSDAGDQLEGAHVADFAAASPAFETVAVDLVHPRRGHRAVVIGDRVHLIGGWDNDDDQLAVESALLP